MKSICIELALYGSKCEFARTDNILIFISFHFWDLQQYGFPFRESRNNTETMSAGDHKK